MDNYHENWLFPCNIKFFDIIEHFKHENTVLWKKRGAIKNDDVVYLYLGAPYSEVRYKCHVINDDVDVETIKKNPYVLNEWEDPTKKHCIMMQLDESYEENIYPLTELRLHDINQVQLPARLSSKALAYLEKG